MGWRVKWHWDRVAERVSMFVAWHLLPRRVRLWVVMRCGADATQGRWSSQIVPDLLFMDAVKRVF